MKNNWLRLISLYACIVMVSGANSSECCKTTCCNSTLPPGPLILKSPVLENYGTWGEWDFCEKGLYASGFALKFEEPWTRLPCETSGGGCTFQFFDNTAINGIKLICSKLGHNDFNHRTPTSAMARYGDWLQTKYCDLGVVNGFQLYSTQYVNISSGEHKFYFDNVGAVNLRVHCVRAGDRDEWIEGEVLDVLQFSGNNNVFNYNHRWGTPRIWTPQQMCKPKQVITGIRTQVDLLPKPGGKFSGRDPSEAGFDRRGVINVEMWCEDIIPEVATCTPRIRDQFIIECNNLNGTSPLQCKYETKVGSRKSGSRHESNGNKESILTSLGFDMNTVLHEFYSRMSGPLNTVPGYEGKVRGETTYFWTREDSGYNTVTVEPGAVIRVFQVIGKCGDMEARTHLLRIYKRSRPIPNPIPKTGFVCKPNRKTKTWNLDAFYKQFGAEKTKKLMCNKDEF